jgi:hypothetical protein
MQRPARGEGETEKEEAGDKGTMDLVIMEGLKPRILDQSREPVVCERVVSKLS